VTTIREHCKLLRLPSVADSCERLAEEAIRERHTHLHFLDALLLVEREERQARAVARRLAEAHLPRVKTLAAFDFTKATSLSSSQNQGDFALVFSEPRRLRSRLLRTKATSLSSSQNQGDFALVFSDPLVSDGRLSGAQGAGAVSGGLWDRQDPSGHGLVCGGLSATA
jgi:hypothetical protein